MAYITEANLKDYLKRNLSSRESALFSTVEAWAKKYIDNFCGTTFEEAVASSRYFDGGDQEISIDPCSSVTGVASVNYDESIINTYDTDDYVLEPRNSNVKTSIRYRTGKLPCGIKNIKVTGKFSSYDGAIPEAIKLASLKLCASVFNNPLNFKRESIEGHSWELSEDVYSEVKKILAPYIDVWL